MPENYPWYELVEGDLLRQSDFLGRCPIIVPPSDFRVPEATEHTEGIKVGVRTYDVVVMSQSCDLEQEKLDLVLVCPHWSLEELGAGKDFFKTAKGKEELRRGNDLQDLRSST
ncbi:MAG: hypothetical protein ACLQOO_02845 [Terriglobia bacterium]